jgi:hypothetical protein
MKRIFTYLILLCIVTLGLHSCFKSVGYDTDVILKAWVQAESSGELTPAEHVIAHAFEADTVDWTITSYENAVAGILTRKGSIEQGVTPMSADVVRIDSVDMDLFQMRVDAPSIVLVAVDTLHRLYGYRQQDLSENLSPLYTSVVFRPWKRMKKYVDGTWRMFNDFYADETTTSAHLAPIRHED